MKLMRVIHKLFGLVILFVSLLVLLSLIHCATQSKYTARRLPSYGTPPSPRRNYGFGVDAEVGEIYVYGGDASKDLWKFVVEGTTVYWEEIGFTGTSPSTTSGSGLFVDAGRIFVFGGFENDLSVTNNLWLFDTIENSWTLLRPNGTVPSPRYAMTFITGENGKYYMLGGQSLDNLFGEIWEYDANTNHWEMFPEFKTSTLNRYQCGQYYKGSIIVVEVLSELRKEDISIFDLKTKKWRYVEVADQPDEVHQNCAIHDHYLYVVPLVKRLDLDVLLEQPIPSTISWEQQIDEFYIEENELFSDIDGFQTLTLDDGIYFFGGLGDNEFRNYMKRYNVKTQTLQTVTPDIQLIPPALEAPSAVQIRRQMLVYGGRLADSTVSEDIYLLDVLNGTWVRPQTTGIRPPGRYGHTAVLKGDVMYVYGGFDVDGRALSDLWRFSYQILRWEQIEPLPDLFSDFPSQRGYHTAVGNTTHMVVYGGIVDSENVLHDVWTFSYKTLEWKLIYSSGDSNAPDQSQLCSSTYVKNNTLIMIGACAEQLVEQGTMFWLFDPATMAWLPPLIAPDNVTTSVDEVAVGYTQTALFNFNDFILLYAGGNHTLVEVHLGPKTNQFIADTPSSNTYDTVPYSNFAATYYGNLVTLFGNFPPSNQVWQFDSQPLCTPSSSGVCYPCTPGTVASSEKCVECQKGHYNDEFGQTQCKKCPEGTFLTSTGANSIDLCVLCRNGFYNNVTGASTCLPCTRSDQLFCPIGSVAPINTTISFVTYEKAAYYDPISMRQSHNTYYRRVKYIVVAAGAVIIIFLFILTVALLCCLKFGCKTHLRRLSIGDCWFSLAHNTPRNQAPINKPTVLGSIFSFFAILVIIDLIIWSCFDYFALNIIYTEALVLKPIDIPPGNYNISLIVHGIYFCSLDKNVDISSSAITGNPLASATPIDSRTCLMNWQCDSYKGCNISYISNLNVAFTITDTKALSYAIDYNITTPYLKNTTYEFFGARVIPNTNQVFRGKDPTIITVSATPVELDDYSNSLSAYFELSRRNIYHGMAVQTLGVTQGSQIGVLPSVEESQVTIVFQWILNPNSKLIQAITTQTPLNLIAQITSLVATVIAIAALLFPYSETTVHYVKKKVVKQNDPRIPKEVSIMSPNSLPYT